MVLIGCENQNYIDKITIITPTLSAKVRIILVSGIQVIKKKRQQTKLFTIESGSESFVIVTGISCNGQLA